MDAVEYIQSFIGKPYLWGGNGPHFDCSGLVQEYLAFLGLDPAGDQTSQHLYDRLSMMPWRSQLDRGSVLFFGRSRSEISHVAVAMSHTHMVEAGGGGSKTTSLMHANQQGAFVRVRPIKARRDLVAVLKPGEEENGNNSK